MQHMEKNLLMFYTGDLHSASAILEQQRQTVEDNTEKEKAQLKISQLTEELHRELIQGNIDCLGPILHAGWEQKRTLVKGITNEKIEYAYEKALQAGATGGKLLGAGGGGFLLFYVPEQNHNAVKNALSHLRYMEFGFAASCSNVIYVGSKPKWY
jgi:D-glycero-alpha-D-manno-heptose-7-phosphate kinase